MTRHAIHGEDSDEAPMQQPTPESSDIHRIVEMERMLEPFPSTAARAERHESPRLRRAGMIQGPPKREKKAGWPHRIDTTIRSVGSWILVAANGKGGNGGGGGGRGGRAAAVRVDIASEKIFPQITDEIGNKKKKKKTIKIESKNKIKAKQSRAQNHAGS